MVAREVAISESALSALSSPRDLFRALASHQMRILGGHAKNGSFASTYTTMDRKQKVYVSTPSNMERTLIVLKTEQKVPEERLKVTVYPSMLTREQQRSKC